MRLILQSIVSRQTFWVFCFLKMRGDGSVTLLNYCTKCQHPLQDDFIIRCMIVGPKATGRPSQSPLAHFVRIHILVEYKYYLVKVLFISDPCFIWIHYYGHKFEVTGTLINKRNLRKCCHGYTECHWSYNIYATKMCLTPKDSCSEVYIFLA